MNLWEILKFLAHLDISPEIGWNFFSIICFGIMAVYSLRRTMKIYNPGFNLKLLPMVLAGAACTLLFYYALMDIPANFIHAVIYSNHKIDSLVAVLLLHLDIRRIPANIPALMIYSTFVFLLMRKYLKFKNFALIWVLQQALITLVILVFGTFNMRYLERDMRTIFFLCCTIPGWIGWVFGFKFFWKSEIEIVREMVMEAG